MKAAADLNRLDYVKNRFRVHHLINDGSRPKAAQINNITAILMSKNAAIPEWSELLWDCGLDFYCHFFAVPASDLHSPKRMEVIFMKIKYEFADGAVTEVEVEDSIGAMIIDSRRKEESAERKHRRHCYSMDAIEYEGAEYGTDDFAASLFDEADRRECSCRVKEAFSHLTEIQQRRLLFLAAGMSYHEIAKREGKNVRAVFESIEAAKKKFKKFYR